MREREECEREGIIQFSNKTGGKPLRNSYSHKFPQDCKHCQPHTAHRTTHYISSIDPPKTHFHNPIPRSSHGGTRQLSRLSSLLEAITSNHLGVRTTHRHTQRAKTTSWLHQCTHKKAKKPRS